jgi:hypothetical protein
LKPNQAEGGGITAHLKKGAAPMERYYINGEEVTAKEAQAQIIANLEALKGNDVFKWARVHIITE